MEAARASERKKGGPDEDEGEKQGHDEDDGHNQAVTEPPTRSLQLHNSVPRRYGDPPLFCRDATPHSPPPSILLKRRGLPVDLFVVLLLAVILLRIESNTLGCA
ncbi:hypothetical protein GW17_00060175 [Ensete ventricosum]|nr:hypothetical protein GW17_00060175 [Ensete ventricosum]